MNASVSAAPPSIMPDFSKKKDLNVKNIINSLNIEKFRVVYTAVLEELIRQVGLEC